MSDDIYKGEESLDAETQEVLNQLKAEGNELMGDKAVKTEPEAEQPKPAVEKPKEEVKTQEEEKPEEPKDENLEEPEEKPKREPRFVKSVPVSKFNDVRKEAQAAKAAAADLQKQIDELKSKPATQEHLDSVDEAIKQVAAKHNLDPQALLDIAKAIKPNTDLPADVKARLAEIDQMGVFTSRHRT